MNTRIPVTAAFLICAASRVTAQAPVNPAATPDNVARQAASQAALPQVVEKWFDVTYGRETILEEKKEIILSAEVAQQIFKESRSPVSNWWETVGQKSENVPKAKHLSEEVLNKLERPALAPKPPEAEPASDGLPTPPRMAIPPRFMWHEPQYGNSSIRKFSTQHVQVMILRTIGWAHRHLYYECLASFKIPRTAAIDRIFDLQALEDRYCQTVKGIGYGDTSKVVWETLGKPDARLIFAWMELGGSVYLKEDVTIVYLNQRIKRVSRGVPEAWRKQIAAGEKTVSYDSSR